MDFVVDCFDSSLCTSGCGFSRVYQCTGELVNTGVRNKQVEFGLGPAVAGSGERGGAQATPAALRLGRDVPRRT